MSWHAVIARELDRAVLDLQRLCRQPSVSAQGLGIAETVRLVLDMVQQAGGRGEVLEDAGGHPVIYAEMDPGSGAPDYTLLYYNHYDVQPADPLHEWSTGPFAAEVRDGKLFARGAADNKGDLIARLAAVRLLREHGGLPCRVKFLIEGEEEIGSPSIQKIMDRHARRFACDACIWEFGDVDAKGRPQLYGGVKGMAYLQLWSRAASADMHSAVGALVESPGWRIVHALATMKDPAGGITIDGFRDSVRNPTVLARRLASRIPFEADNFRSRLGLTRPLLTDTSGTEPSQASCFEPTCTICGVESGYYGPGSKTVLPRQAQAKVDCRLVPDQDPQEILHKVRRHLDRRGFSDVEVELLSGAKAYMTDPDHPFVRLVRETARDAWQAEPVYHPSASGTGPMHSMGSALGVPIVSTGCGWFGARVHAPDESIRLTDLQKGILHQVLLLQQLGQN